MNFKINVVASFLIFLMFYTNAQESNIPKSKKAIICLTYDDGLESQLTTALSQLDEVNLKATFFLNAIQGASSNIGEASPAVAGWTKAAGNGHELANHTLFHACPEKLGWNKTFAIEGYTVDKMLTEIKTQNSILALLDPNRKTRSFAYPCNNFLIGDTDYAKIIEKKGLVRYGRAGGDRTSIISELKQVEAMKAPSWMVEEGTTVKELIEFAEKVKKSGGMGIYQFHGIGGQFFKISAETHKAFLNYLKTNQQDYWVTTFSEAMNFIKSK
ncbi:MAG TPA: polysaccharide deacetylase family protein [Flavitalea sp.]|nr:polysaccharide deacetylase family protein [Flavitalea sp.]